MGLDMYGCTLPFDPDAEGAPKGVTFDEFFYWRKHYELDKWFEKLNAQKGEPEPDAGLWSLKLTLEDLDALEAALRSRSLPYAHNDGMRKNDLKFVAKARHAIQRGLFVFYIASS